MKGKKLIIQNNFLKKALNKAGKCLHAPEQRIILGATALATQPFIDLNNKSVDKETRKTSAARTVAKIIAGTLVGVGVRYAGIKFIKNNCKYIIENGKILPVKGKSFFLPSIKKMVHGLKKTANSGLNIAEFEKRMDKYIKAMGTLAATIAMIGTNFLLDAPLTKWLTKVFVNMVNKQSEQNKKEVK